MDKKDKLARAAEVKRRRDSVAASLAASQRNARRAVAKVASLFLAAISVALIRAGIVGMVAALPRKL